MKRLYEPLLQQHLHHYPQMLFITGPRQVGKTTLAHHLADAFPRQRYLNWDDQDDRAVIMSGQRQLIESTLGQNLDVGEVCLVLDEIHKYKSWKNYLKGYFDHNKSVKTVVTGSARLDVFNRGGDSLMGRYFAYRIHPLSVAECVRTDATSLVAPPRRIPLEQWDALLKFGGFPDPWLRQDASYHQRWQSLRFQQLMREDIASLTAIADVAQLELMAQVVQSRAGNIMRYSDLAKAVRVSDVTCKRWLDVLQSLYYCFSIQPWQQSVARSWLKTPKVYVWDWSIVQDPGQRFENLVAVHLLKAVHYWNDAGLARAELYYIRDKDQREVDFLVTKEGRPWFLVEAKVGASSSISRHLYHYQAKLGVDHAFQVVQDLPFVEVDAFSVARPVVVPALTLLSQLI